MVALLIVVGAVCFWGFKSGDSRSFQIAKNLDIFNSIVKELDMFYVDTIDPNKTIREGIDAMLYSLDPYTEYYPEDDQSELEQMLKNSYGGIGSVITWNPKLKRSMISEPYENMPAANVGLKAGDILMEIDGKDLAGKNNQEVSEMLRGQVGTSFKLKVQRPGTEKPLDFDIVRRSIQLPFIPYYTVLDNNIGYINLSTFSGNPSKEFKQAFLDLKKRGMTSLVIDLRNNGGGLLDEARPISSIHDIPAIGRFIFTLDSYIGMYQNHKDLLQYNDNFNNYITHQTVRQEELANFHASLNSVNTRLHMMYAKAKEDKTFRTDIPEEQFMRVTVHTMMAACTHYAGGFIWGATDNKDYTGDLLLLKEMILNYARNDANL